LTSGVVRRRTPDGPAPHNGSVETEAPAPARTRPPRAGGRPSALTVLGVVLLVAGLACLGWVGYQYVGTGVVARRSFDREAEGLRSQWAAPAVPSPSSGAPAPDTPSGTTAGDTTGTAAVVPGTAVALLRVPRFGDTYEVPVVAGTDLRDLARGVGHYDGTAAPGEVGNFALAGHRVTHGEPFAKLLTLRRGDQVLVETREAVFTYVMDTSPADLTVDETAGWVLDPVPDQPGAAPSRALLTLTTCQDLFHSPDRSVGFGHLESTRNK
jgi:sortase A